jgi:hypothetical protein
MEMLVLWGSTKRRRLNDFEDLINFIIIIAFNIIMGNYFKVPDGVKTNKKFVKFFRKRKKHLDLSFLEKLQGVFECYEYYMKAYNPNPTLNEDEFDDVFSSLLNDCQAYFKLLEDREMK